jgi:hypothetical protein
MRPRDVIFWQLTKFTISWDSREIKNTNTSGSKDRTRVKFHITAQQKKPLEICLHFKAHPNNWGNERRIRIGRGTV